MEDEESLETCALICQLSDSVQDQVHNLLAHSVVTSGIIVGSILLASHQLLRVEQLSVGAGSDLIYYCRLKVHKYSPEINYQNENALNILKGPCYRARLAPSQKVLRKLKMNANNNFALQTKS